MRLHLLSSYQGSEDTAQGSGKEVKTTGVVFDGVGREGKGFEFGDFTSSVRGAYVSREAANDRSRNADVDGRAYSADACSTKSGFVCRDRYISKQTFISRMK